MIFPNKIQVTILFQKSKLYMQIITYYRPLSEILSTLSYLTNNDCLLFEFFLIFYTLDTQIANILIY